MMRNVERLSDEMEKMAATAERSADTMEKLADRASSRRRTQ